MSDDKNLNPENGGENQTDKGTDTYADLRGKKDEKGIPLHPEEKAEYFKNKFSNSSSEAQKLLEKNKTLQEENETLKTNSERYTADQLAGSIPGWNTLDIQQQKAILESYGALKKDLEAVKSQVATIIDDKTFEDTFKKVSSDPDFAIIKKHKREFKQYAYQSENLNVPLTILAKSFLVDKKLIGTKPDANQDAGRPGLDAGSGGTRFSPPEAGYTGEEMENIRKTDPRKYNRLAREGKLILREE